MLAEATVVSKGDGWCWESCKSKKERMERVCPPSIPDQSAFRFLGLQWPSHRSNSALLSELPRTKLCSGIHQLLRPGNRLYSGIHSRRRQAQQRVASVRPSGTRVLSGAIDDEWCSCPVRRFMGQYVEGPTATHRPGDKMHTACIRGLRLQWALQWGNQVSNVCRDRADLRACLRASVPASARHQKQPRVALHHRVVHPHPLMPRVYLWDSLWRNSSSSGVLSEL